ncbi:MAG: hypothetical protein JJU26_08345, partial [Oceanicaulis sp.]|nr:hypothetical protein [Oceanicaulis sp.]
PIARQSRVLTNTLPGVQAGKFTRHLPIAGKKIGSPKAPEKAWVDGGVSSEEDALTLTIRWLTSR